MTLHANFVKMVSVLWSYLLLFLNMLNAEKNTKSFLRHKARNVMLISISQTSDYTAR